ncbi:MAG: hypothetical protein RL648_73 [Verrucomicrobiota bacterium]
MNKPKINLIVGLLALAGAPLFGVQINEVRIDEPGATDSNEFIELKGAPGTSLDGYWYLVLGDHTSFGSDDGVNVPDKRGGTVEFAIRLDGYAIPDDGLFLITTTDMQIDVFGLSITDVDMVLTNMNFENSDNVTHLLVKGYTGIEVTDYADQYDDLAVDIDDDDDGTPNATLPWTELVDAIGIVEVPNDSNPEEYAYGAVLGGANIGPDGSFTPGMVYRGSDDGLWQIGPFNLLNEAGDGLFAGDDLRGPALDTPGAPNPASPPPVVTPSINSFSPTTAQSGEVVTVKGQNFNGATAVTVGGVAATYTVVDAETIEITVDETLVSGVIEVTTPAGQATSASELSLVSGGVIFFEDFEADLGDFTVISAASNYDWRHRTFGGNGFAQMSGFGADSASDDWLISPAIDLTSAMDPVLSFTTARNFDGPALKVLISSNYDGLNPATASWTEITATLSEGGYQIVSSGDIDLSAYRGGSIHVAFQYTSTGPASGEGATIQVHEFLVQVTAIQTEVNVVFTEDFQESLGDFQVISVASNKDWAAGNYQGEGYAGINGFGGDTASDDWLISPAIDLSNGNAPVLTFSTARNFGGPALQVLASGDYDGVNPAAATWTPLSAALSESGYTVVESGDIDLSAYVGGTVHIAFRYTSDGGGAGQGAVYQINYVTVTDTPATTPSGDYFAEDFQESLGEFQVISVASNKDWALGNYQGEGYAGINGFGGDTASDDWLISPGIDLSSATTPVLNFSTARNFGGPALQVLASGDYDGVNPAAATWTPLSAALSESGYAVVESGDVDLSAYVGGTVHIAFRYTSDGGGPGQGAVYQINEVAVRESTSTFTVGWTQHPVASWTYMYTPAWGYNLTMGFINIESLPWVYQPTFGYIYMNGGSIEAGLWCYAAGSGWIWVATGNGGWFEFATGGWNSFLNPSI